jgi:DNA-binding response OmpR family regulator
VTVAGELILIVDDGADMREFVANYVLKPNGYDWLEARDGLEAFQVIQANNPDLILLDLQMPRLDGIGLLNKLREHGISIPVVLMTFYGSEEIAIEVFRRGVRDYVIKPFTDEELLAAIETALSETRLRRERDTLTERLVVANRDLQRRVRELQALYGIGKTLTEVTDVGALLVRIVDAMAYVTSASEAAIFLYDEAGGGLFQRAVKSGDRLAQLVQNAADDPLVQQAAQNGQALVSEVQAATADHPGYLQLCVPLLLGRTVIGALGAVVPATVAVEHQLDLLGALADYTAIGLERARLAATLEAMQQSK